MKVESQDMFFITSMSELLHCIYSMAFDLNNDTNSDVLIHIFRGGHGSGDTLESCGISDGSTVHFTLSTFPDDIPDHKTFFIDDVVPSVQQTKKGISVFLSSLYIIVSTVS